MEPQPTKIDPKNAQRRAAEPQPIQPAPTDDPVAELKRQHEATVAALQAQVKVLGEQKDAAERDAQQFAATLGQRTAPQMVPGNWGRSLNQIGTPVNQLTLRALRPLHKAPHATDDGREVVLYYNPRPAVPQLGKAAEPSEVNVHQGANHTRALATGCTVSVPPGHVAEVTCAGRTGAERVVVATLRCPADVLSDERQRFDAENEEFLVDFINLYKPHALTVKAGETELARVTLRELPPLTFRLVEYVPGPGGYGAGQAVRW